MPRPAGEQSVSCPLLKAAMDFNFAKELYFRELDGRFQQDARTSTNVGLLSLVGGLLAILIRAMWPAESWLSLIGLLFCGIAVILYLMAVIYVLRATLGYIYESLPPADVLLKHSEDLSTYYRDNPEVEGNAEVDFSDFLTRKMVSATARNWSNNLSRSARYYRASQLLAFVVIFAVLASAAAAANEIMDLFKQTGG